MNTAALVLQYFLVIRTSSSQQQILTEAANPLVTTFVISPKLLGTKAVVIKMIYCTCAMALHCGQVKFAAVNVIVSVVLQL